MPTFKLGEFFCGPGGLALGAFSTSVEGFSIEHAWASDYDPDTCETYRQNICPDRPDSVLCKDIRKLAEEELAEINTAHGPIDAFAYGFPCNDFSLVGERKGIKGNYGGLYTYGLNVLKKFHPKFFVAENVGGLRASDNGSAFTKILTDLHDCGYRIYPHLYEFEKYGVPQSRHRYIIVGIQRRLNVTFRVPAPTTPAPSEWISARQAIECPPIPADAANQERTKQSRRVVERLMHIRPGENIWQARAAGRMPPELDLVTPSHGISLSQIYKRLDPDKPSYTITGSGGGGTHVYHWSEPRALTNREKARLQTFPDDFVFHGSKESVRRQIGMAVPCAGAKIIFEAILKSFANIDYPSLPTQEWLPDPELDIS